MSSSNEVPTPPEAIPEAPPEAVKPRLGRKLYLVIGLVAIAIIATASILFFTQLLPGAIGEPVRLGLNYSEGEKMTYNISIIVDKDDAILGAIIGFISGLAVALGGAIKDSPYEGFDQPKFFRSPIVGAIEGAIITVLIPTIILVVLFFMVIGTERITTETYKLVRAKMPMKFKYGEWGVPKKIREESVVSSH